MLLEKAPPGSAGKESGPGPSAGAEAPAEGGEGSPPAKRGGNKVTPPSFLRIRAPPGAGAIILFSFFYSFGWAGRERVEILPPLFFGSFPAGVWAQSVFLICLSRRQGGKKTKIKYGGKTTALALGFLLFPSEI